MVRNQQDRYARAASQQLHTALTAATAAVAASNAPLAAAITATATVDGGRAPLTITQMNRMVVPQAIPATVEETTAVVNHNDLGISLMDNLLRYPPEFPGTARQAAPERGNQAQGQ